MCNNFNIRGKIELLNSHRLNTNHLDENIDSLIEFYAQYDIWCYNSGHTKQNLRYYSKVRRFGKTNGEADNELYRT